MALTTTVPIYLRVSKTLADRLKDKDAETLLRIGLLVHAMPDGSTIIRKRGEILGLDTSNKPKEVEF